MTPFATPQHVSNLHTTTLVFNKSACSCINCGFTVIPPSALNSDILGNSLLSVLSHTLNAMDSITARSICCLLVQRLRPRKPPVMLLIQQGEQILPKVGQNTTPLLSSTWFNSSNSLKKPTDLSQFRVPAPHSIDASIPYSIWSPSLNIIVVMKSLKIFGSLPMDIIMKQPVPYVHFTQPLLKLRAQAEDCWSPKMLQISSPYNGPPVTIPTFQNDPTTSGRHYFVSPTDAMISSSQ